MAPQLSAPRGGNVEVLSERVESQICVGGIILDQRDINAPPHCCRLPIVESEIANRKVHSYACLWRPAHGSPPILFVAVDTDNIKDSYR